LPQIKTGWLIFSTASDIIIPGWKYSPGLKATIALILGLAADSRRQRDAEQELPNKITGRLLNLLTYVMAA
jgi:hypothetical protein